MVTLMREHPGWRRWDRGAERVVRRRTTLWRLTWRDGADEVSASPVGEASTSRPVVDRIDAVPAHAAVLASLCGRLTAVTPLLRVRTGSLWEAVGTAIVRQVIRADQARAMYRRFCDAYGEPVPGQRGPLATFPDAHTVLRLPIDAYDALRMGFKRPALVAAAQAVLTNGEAWARLDPASLVEVLQRVPRIGPWTAGAAAADFTGDFAVYPHGDLAVRTWARRAAPDIAWPAEEPAFAALWRRSSDHFGVLTALTLAWGDSHARMPNQPTGRPVDEPVTC